MTYVEQSSSWRPAPCVHRARPRRLPTKEEGEELQWAGRRNGRSMGLALQAQGALQVDMLPQKHDLQQERLGLSYPTCAAALRSTISWPSLPLFEAWRDVVLRIH